MRQYSEFLASKARRADPSPFMGIGSEGVMSLRYGRRFIGVEKKQSYWRQACRYMHAEDRQVDMIAGAAA